MNKLDGGIHATDNCCFAPKMNEAQDEGSQLWASWQCGYRKMEQTNDCKQEGLVREVSLGA